MAASLNIDTESLSELVQPGQPLYASTAQLPAAIWWRFGGGAPIEP